MEAHDIRPDGTRTERLRASGGAIATAATHPAQGQVKMRKRHTWQVAMQVAAGKALCYAEQLRRKGRRVTISLPSATTARDLQPTRPGETRPKMCCTPTRRQHHSEADIHLQTGRLSRVVPLITVS